MKAQTGPDVGTGYVRAVSCTAANDLDELARLVTADDEIVHADDGYQGVGK